MVETHDVGITLLVSRFGESECYLAKSNEFPNLMLVGTNTADLQASVEPVARTFFETRGEKILSISVDYTKIDRIEINAVVTAH